MIYLQLMDYNWISPDYFLSRKMLAVETLLPHKIKSTERIKFMKIKYTISNSIEHCIKVNLCVSKLNFVL